jgi:hypothetical protein
MGNSGGAIVRIRIHEADLRRSLRLLRRAGRFLIFVLLFVFPALPLSATTYYVDNCVIAGNDSNNGTSPSTPWLTIAHVNARSFNPGDSILFQSTCEWREELSTGSSGSAGNPITFGSYGSGAQPIISGANLLALSWTNVSGNLWSATLATQPYIVLFNGTLGTREASSSAVTAANEWFWGSSTLYVYSTSNPATAFTSPGIEAGARPSTIAINNNYVTVYNLELTGADEPEHGSITMYSVSNITLNGITTLNNTGYGVEDYSATAPANNNITVENSTVAWSGGSGIVISGYTNTMLVQNNAVHHNGWDGYDASSPRGISGSGPNNINITIQYNDVYENGQGIATAAMYVPGIDCDTCGTGVVIQYNLSWGNSAGGIVADADNNLTIAYNVSYNNAQSGIYAFSDANTSMTGILIYNNTVYGNTGSTGNAGIRLDGPGTSNSCTNNFIENNIVLATVSAPNLLVQGGCDNTGGNGSGNIYTYNSFGTAASNFITWGSTTYSTYSSWETATGNCGTAGCSHSDQTSPTFTNAAGNNFTLTSASSAIDAGTNLGSTYQMALNAISSWPSAVVLVPQSLNNSGWEIGAFAFLQDSRPEPPTSVSATVN